MIKEYKTIQEIASPLMIVKNVEGVTYDELAEIELPNGEVRRCKVLEVEDDHAVVHETATNPTTNFGKRSQITPADGFSCPSRPRYDQ